MSNFKNPYALNILTKGLATPSTLVGKGFIFNSCKIERKDGTSSVYSIANFSDLQEYNKILDKEDPDNIKVIKIYFDPCKEFGDITVSADIIRTHIKAYYMTREYKEITFNIEFLGTV